MFIHGELRCLCHQEIPSKRWLTSSAKFFLISIPRFKFDLLNECRFVPTIAGLLRHSLANFNEILLISEEEYSPFEMRFEPRMMSWRTQAAAVASVSHWWSWKSSRFLVNETAVDDGTWRHLLMSCRGAFCIFLRLPRLPFTCVALNRKFKNRVRWLNSLRLKSPPSWPNIYYYSINLFSLNNDSRLSVWWLNVSVCCTIIELIRGAIVCKQFHMFSQDALPNLAHCRDGWWFTRSKTSMNWVNRELVKQMLPSKSNLTSEKTTATFGKNERSRPKSFHIFYWALGALCLTHLRFIRLFPVLAPSY